MLLLTVVGLCALIATSNAQCNPLQGTCTAAIPGLVTSSYSIDFTQQKSNPDNWTLADYTTVNYGSDGVEFAFTKRFDAPYMWTSFYVLFGKIEVVLQAAPGQGIVSSSVMMSDDLDEIDWEWSGSNFASPDGKVQTNYFGKGILGNYERGAFTAETTPTTMFHTYTLDWTSTSLTWYIDGVAIRTLQNTGATSGVFQYPQTPSQLHLGLWNAGDPTEDPGTTEWAGGIDGYTDLTKVPYTAYVKSVKITNYNPCSSWKYPAGFSGKWQDVKCTNTTIATSSPSSSGATSTPTNLPCTYTDVTGDTGYGIAAKLGVSFDDLNKTNLGQDWDQLEPGITVLNVPGGNCSGVSSSVTTTSSATKSSSMTTTPSKTSSIDFSSSVISSTMTLISSSTSSAKTSSSAPAKSPSPSSTVLSSGKSASSTATPSSDPVKSPSTSSSLLSGGKSASSMATPSSDPGKSPSTTPSSSAPSVPTSSSALAKTTNIISTGGFASSSVTSGPTTSSPSSTNGAGFSVASPATTIAMGKGIYTVVSGDYGYKIAPEVGCTNFDQLSALNPPVDWNTLLIGQTLTACGVVSGSVPTAGGANAGDATAGGTNAGGATAGGATAGGATAGGANAGGANAGGANVGGATAGGATAGGATAKNSATSAPAPSSVQTTFNSQCTMPAGGCVYANPSATGYAPWATNCAHYAVQTLDTDCAIANKFGIDYVCTLLALNPKTNWQSLEVGQQLLIGNPVITPTAGVTSIPCPTVNPYISTTAGPTSSSSASLKSSTIKPASSSISTATTSLISMQSTSFSIPSNSSTTVATTKASSALSTSTSPAQSATTQPTSASIATSRVTTTPISSAVPATTSKPITTSSPPTTTPKASTTSTMICNHDNCLNNLLDARYSSTALLFCPQYIATQTGAPEVAIPTVITNCQNNDARVSSACACLISMQPTSTTPSTNKAAASPSPSLWWTGTNWVNIGNLGARQLGRWGNGWKGKALGEVKGSDKVDAYPSATGDGKVKEAHAAVHLGKRDIHRGDGGRLSGWHAQRREAEVEERGEGLKTGGKGKGKGDFWKWYE